ncbi:palmitoyltransferase ZDHHC4 isoform X2 [Phycodurus eques]|uniref:palmitoyltransferase ZDHHC4 isoform X2 n=1 Tax=Phycodurus eques TaxID=693459 RepID=UPI002ACE7B79|nr:palmitoyltransferase ZDHHC4 isoform X2 [Phycodurus eques]
MDFLTLFAIYVVVVLTCIVLVCRYSGQQQNNPFTILLNTISTVVAPITPKWLQRLFQGTLHRLFHQRSNMFIYLHIFLEGVVYAEFTYEVFGYCREMGISLTRLSVPYVLLAIKTLFYYLCIKRDPGTVTKKKLSGLLNMYPYDRRLFHPGISCPTCHLIKPARSKHCRVCDRCIQRFDHHCVWVNNCIGALNTRYFLLYLFSLSAMAGDIAILTGDMLLEAVLLSGLLRAVYIDEYGQQQPTDPLFVTQCSSIRPPMSGTKVEATFVSTATQLPQPTISVARRLTTLKETTTAEGSSEIWERYFFLESRLGKKTLRRMSLCCLRLQINYGFRGN